MAGFWISKKYWVMLYSEVIRNKFFFIWFQSRNLESSSKERIPNAFSCTAFRKHYKKILDERNFKKKSDMFFFLLCTTDRKELMNEFKENVSLNPIDTEFENFRDFHQEKKNFLAQHLDLNVSDERRKIVVEIMYNVFKNIYEARYANLLRNADHLFATKSDSASDDIVWIGASKKRFGEKKYKLTY